MDLVTHSEAQTFRDCRQKWELSYEQGLKSKFASLPFFLGTVLHVYLQHYYLGERPQLPVIAAKVRATSGKFLPQVDDAAHLGITCMGALLELYPKFDCVKRLKLKVLGTEMPFKMPMPGGKIHTGMIDVLAKDSYGRIYIIDHKSTSQIDDSFIESFGLNSQFQTYLWAVRGDPAIIKLAGGLAPYAIIPNLVKKPTLRLGKTESVTKFVARIKEHILTNPGNYFHSEPLYYEHKTNKRFEASTEPLISEIARVQKLQGQARKDALYPNFSQCDGHYGRCPFQGVCRQVPGAEAFLTQKAVRHEELLNVLPQTPYVKLATHSTHTSRTQPLKVTYPS